MISHKKTISNNILTHEQCQLNFLELLWLPFVVLLISSFYWWGRANFGPFKFPLCVLYLPLIIYSYGLTLAMKSPKPKITWNFSMTGLAVMLYGMLMSFLDTNSLMISGSVLCEIILYMMLYLLLLNTLKTYVGIRRIVITFILCIAFLALEGIFKFFIAKSIWRLGAGTVHTATNMGAFMFQAGFFLATAKVIFDTAQRRLARLFWSGIVVIMTVALIFSYSRGAWLTTIIGLVVFIMYRKILFVVFILVGIILFPFLPDAITNRMLSTFDLDQRSTVILSNKSGWFLEATISNTSNLRMENQNQTINDYLDYPSLGQGLGTYHGASQEKGEAAPHNSYLRILAESGPIALFGFICFLVAIGWKLFQCTYHGDSSIRWLLIGCQAIFLTHLFYMLLGDWTYQIYYWFLTGIYSVVARLFNITSKKAFL